MRAKDEGKSGPTTLYKGKEAPLSVNRTQANPGGKNGNEKGY